MLPHNEPISYGSSNEKNVWDALVHFDVPFRYQVPIFGGSSQRGGIILDFLVYNPFEIAVPVGSGGFFHRFPQSTEEQYALGILIEHFKGRVVLLTEDETDTYEEAENAVRIWIVERPGSYKY